MAGEGVGVGLAVVYGFDRVRLDRRGIIHMITSSEADSQERGKAI